MEFNGLAPVHTNNSNDTAVSEPMLFPPFEPMSGLADSHYDPWSAYPSSDSNYMPNNNPFTVWSTNYDSGSAAQPALTATSSGTQSEVDEMPTMDDLYGFPLPSIQESFDAGSTPADNNSSNRRSLPPGFFGNTDFNVPVATNDFQTPVGSVLDSDSGKSRNDPSLGIHEVWQSPTPSNMANLAPLNPGRPQSQSVGPASAPNDDLIRQLFPDIDINNALFGMGNNSTAMPDGKGFGGMNHSAPTSAALDTMPNFTNQGWNDGSMSVPNVEFPSPFNLSQNFSTDDFGWPCYE